MVVSFATTRTGVSFNQALLNTPSHCVSGADFTSDHAMIFRHGGLTFV